MSVPVAAIERQVRAATADEGLPTRMAAQVVAVLERKLRLYAQAPMWCVPELPRRVAGYLGAPDEVGEALAASAILYHCAADVVDDAQDGELEAIPGWPGGGWEEAVTVGLYLLSAHAAHLAGIPAPAEVRTGWARAFGRSGRLLTAGQHDDLGLHPDAPLDEQAVLALGGRKAGGALSGLLSLGPIWAGQRDLGGWELLGERLGRLLQAASDLEPYVGRGPHADLASAKLTLPLLAARDIRPDLREVWAAGLPLDPARQERLRAGVRGSGALDYVALRLGALRTEVEGMIEALGGEDLGRWLAPVLGAARVATEPMPL